MKYVIPKGGSVSHALFSNAQCTLQAHRESGVHRKPLTNSISNQRCGYDNTYMELCLPIAKASQYARRMYVSLPIVCCSDADAVRRSILPRSKSKGDLRRTFVHICDDGLPANRCLSSTCSCAFPLFCGRPNIVKGRMCICIPESSRSCEVTS